MSDSTEKQKRLEPLWHRYKQANDLRAREQLILEYVGLVKYVAGRLAIGLPSSVDVDDLHGYGVFGLMDAIDKYDLDRGIKFESYAISRIRGAMIDGLRAVDWAPRSVRRKARELETTVSLLESRLGRSATDAEIAEAMDVSLNEYYRTLEEVQVAALTSLDEFFNDGQSDNERLRIVDTIANSDAENPEIGPELEAVRDTLAAAIDQLPEKERVVIALYYYEGLTLKEIGKVLGLTESRISQLHTRAIIRLRGRLEQIRDSVL